MVSPHCLLIFVHYYMDEPQLMMSVTMISMALKNQIIEDLSSQVDEPGLLSKAQLEALIHYAFSVNLRDKYSNINEICLKNLDILGRNIDEMVNSVFPSNISNRDEMIESFNEYLEIEKAHGLNSVNKIEEAFSSKVHIDEDVDVEGIFSSLLISIKKSMQETNLF